MAQQDMMDGLMTKLTADQSAGTVFDDLNGQIYDTHAAQSDGSNDPLVLPWLVVSIVTDVPRETAASDQISATVDMELWSARSAGVEVNRDINDKIFTLLHRSTTAITGFVGITMGCVDRGVQEVIEDAILTTSTYEIWASAA